MTMPKIRQCDHPRPVYACTTCQKRPVDHSDRCTNRDFRDMCATCGVVWAEIARAAL